MSLCIRKLSSKLPTTVCTRKKVTFLDARIQNISKSKLTDLVLQNDILQTCKTVPAVSNYLHKYNDENNLAWKLDNELEKSPITRVADNYERSWIQRHELKMRRNHLNMPYVISTQTNVGIKEKESSPTKDPIFDTSSSSQNEDSSSSREGRPSVEQIERIKENLALTLPTFFVYPMDNTIFTADLIVVNNIRGVTTKGFSMYFLQSSALKIYAHMKFIYVKMEVLKITANPEDDSVKVRWRICGISGFKIFSRFLAFKNPFKVKDTIQREQETWYDGFSTYYINDKGKVHQLTIDKVMPDSDLVKKKEYKIPPVKLAICIGISNLDFLLCKSLTKL